MLVETEVQVLRWATLRTRGNFRKPIQEGVPAMQRGPKLGPKAEPSRLTYSTFRCDGHLPAMIWLTGTYTPWTVSVQMGQPSLQRQKSSSCLFGDIGKLMIQLNEAAFCLEGKSFEFTSTFCLSM